MNNKLKIMNYLGKNFGKKFTMHELSILTKIPYATFYRTIAQIQDLVDITAIGKAKTININTNNKIVNSYLSISSYEEKKDFLKNQPIISKIDKELETKDIVLLFGSYAKKLENEKSDIDLLIINKKGNKTVSFANYETIFKKKINPIFITQKELKLMLEEKTENLGKQAIKNHIVLRNPQDFWNIVLI